MAKKLKIQVEFESVKESLSKIGADLNKVFDAKIQLFDPKQKEEANALKTQITKVLKEFDEASSKGKMSRTLVKYFKDSFEEIETGSKKLHSAVEKNLKTEPFKFASPEQTALVAKLNQEIDELEVNLNNLKEAAKAVKGTNFQSFLEGKFGKEGAAEFKMGSIKKMSTGASALSNKADDLDEAYNNDPSSPKGKKGLGKEREEWQAKIKYYRDLAKEVGDLAKAENAAGEQEKQRLKEIEQELASKKLAIQQIGEQATEAGRKSIASLESEAEAIKRNLKEMKFKEAVGLQNGLDVFGGLMEGVTGKIKGFVTGITSGVLILNTIRRVFNDTIKTMKDLDQAFNNIAIVTTYTTEEVWQMKDAFVSIANTAGMSVIEVTNIANEFFRQGRSLSETLKLTEAAGIAAKVAGIEATKSVDYLTSAINGYKLSADQAMAVSDKFAALAAGSATDYEELAIALSKVAAQAYSAGVNMDNMMGFIAKALETTREAPENIGTAFKTIFARMSELKDYGKTLEDGMDVNRIDKALKSIGVNLTDQENELRSLDEVLMEVGSRWEGLTKNQKAYITTALAGTRQQTRLLAIFEDFDRTLELTEMSANSLGATFAQQEKYYNSIAYAQNQLTVAWQNFVSSLGSSSVFILFYNTLSGLVNVLNDLVSTFGDVGSAIIAILSVIGLAIVSQQLYMASIHKTAIAMAMSTGLSYEDAAAKVLVGTTNLATALSFDAINTAISTFILKMTAAMVTMAEFLLLNPYGWAILAVAGLALYANQLQKAKNKHKDFAESMKKTQAEIFNLRKEADDLESLLEKYQAIELSVNKTKEDLDQQAQLLEQMQDLLGEDSAIDLTGKFNPDVVSDKLEELRRKADEEFNGSIAETLSKYETISEGYSNATETIVKQQLLIQSAIENEQVKSYSHFLEQETKKREEILATEALRLNAEKNLTKVIEGKAIDYNGNTVGSDAFFTVVDEDKLQEAQDLLRDLFAQDFENSPLSKQIETLKNLDFDLWDKDVLNALSENSPAIKNIQSIMEKLNADNIQSLQEMIRNSDLTVEQFYKINAALEKTNLTITEQEQLFKMLTAKGGNSFATIEKFATETNMGLFEMLDLTQQLSDAMSSVSIEGLDSDLQSLRSVSSNIEKINSMIVGESEYDLAFLHEMVRLYPEIGDAISKNAKISEETSAAIMAEDKKAFETKIGYQIQELQKTFEINKIKIKALESMLVNEDELNQAMAEGNVDLQTSTDAEIYNAYLVFLRKKFKAAATTNQAIALNALENSDLTPEQKAAEEARILGIEEQSSALEKLFNDTASVNKSTTSFSDRIRGQIDALNGNNDTILAQISLLQGLKNNIDKVTKATNSNTKAAEKYKAALDEIYILTQQLSVLEQELSRLEFMEEHAKTGEEYLTSIYSQNAALEAQISVTEDLIDAQKRSQDGIYESLGNLRGSVQLINGRLVPIMSKYINLGEEQQKLIDESVESYNDLSEGIGDNSQALLENAAAIEENLQKIEDKTVEFYDILADAIKNSEKKKFEELKKGFELEKKLLDERRKMYEKAFAEEDYTDSLQEVTDERAAVISQLTELEGASDLASVTKRKELLERKAELDKTYNKTVLDYNREALLELFDEEEELIEQREADYEAAYEERINSVEWLESEILRIMGEGQDATIMYLKEHSQEYQDAWSLTKDNIEGEWLNLYDIVNTKVDEILTNIPDFSGLLEQLRQAAAYVGQINSGNPAPNNPGPNPPPKVNNPTPVKSDAEILRESWNAEVGKLQDLANKEFWDEWSSQHATMVDMVKRSGGALAKGIASGGEDTKKWKFKKYKKGGIADFTGPAWLDGTKKRPERILSPVQTELFESMVNSLESLNSTPGNTTSNSSINIENITITTGHLNAAQDFKEAGRTLAQEFKTAISERGIAINLKR